MAGISWNTDVGINHVGAYQVSGRPFASGSIDASAGAVKIEFPCVTRWVQIINHSVTELSCSFSENGFATGNYFKIHAVGSSANHQGGYHPRLELKVSEMWFTGSANFDVVAGLTNISPEKLNTSVGTSWSGSVGVG